MADQFEYDVFLSHASADKPAVRELAQRLKGDGLKVWFDDWVIQPGDSIPLAIEKGLESSRTLVLVMSQAAFDSEWVTLERHTALFRDPTNQQRRFIPLRLDDCEIKDSLKQFAYVDWREKNAEQYTSLLTSCARRAQGGGESPFASRVLLRSDALPTIAMGKGSHFGVVGYGMELGLWDMQAAKCLRVVHCEEQIHGVSITPSGGRVAAISGDAIFIWDTESEQVNCIRGDTGVFHNAVAISDDGNLAVSAVADEYVQVWDLSDRSLGKRLHASIDANERAFLAVSIASDVRMVVAGCTDHSVRIFSLDTGECLKKLEGHGDWVNAVDVTSDARMIVSGSNDLTIRVWDRLLDDGGKLEGHTDAVNSVKLTRKGQGILSGSADGTIRFWQTNLGRESWDQGLESRRFGQLISIGEDNTVPIRSVGMAGRGRFLACSDDNAVRMWWLSLGAKVRTIVESSRYTNAKVLLVGDSGVGKSGLAIRLAKNEFAVTASTDGHWATQLRLARNDDNDVIVESPTEIADADLEKEVWLWDFAGQADYRLIHQLFMDETALAVLVFNPQSENPFEGLGQWDRDLARAARRGFAKLLVAGRCDRGGIMVSRESIEQFAKERGFEQYLQTSAKTGDGCVELRDAIEQSIDWDSIPWTASPRIFKLLKEQIIRLSDESFTLLRMSELKQQLETRLPDDPFAYEELKAVVGLLAGPGHVWQLEFGQFVLLHPERINSYAAAVGRTVRSHLQQIGVIHESAMLSGQLNFGDIQRLPPREEAIVLRAMHQTLVDHGFCLTQETDAGPLLVFPSYFNRERRDQIDHPRIFGTFRFSGALEELYATLVVQLHHTRTFETEELWRYAADFRVVDSRLSLRESGAVPDAAFAERKATMVGLKMRKLGEGDAEIIAYCDPGVAVESKVTFIQYIHDHLKRYDSHVTLVRHYVCRNPECGEALSDVKAILRAREKGKTELTCQYCDEPIPLWDELEQELASEKYEARVREMEATSRAGIDRESRDLMLEYHAFAIAEECSQRFVPVGDDEIGVQARIELTDLSGQPGGRCLYLQLRPAEVYKSISSNRADRVVFEVGSKNLAERWKRSESPVMLVHRTDDGFIRWMDVSDWLKAKNKDRKTPLKQIVFDGEPFTALNLQRIRDRIFSQSGE